MRHAVIHVRAKASSSKAALLAAALVFAARGGAGAAGGRTCTQARDTTTSLAPLFVTATRVAQPFATLLADVTVIDAATIAQSGADSLAELLQRQPGVEIVQNGGRGGTSGIFVRGTNTDQTLVLVDGLRVSSSSTRHDGARGDSARPDRAHRDPARPGVRDVRQRRDRRRRAGLHAQGRRHAACQRVRRLRPLRHVGRRRRR